MSRFDWKAQSFLQKGTSKPLAGAVIGFFILVVALVGASYFYKVDGYLLADGEIIPVSGEKLIKAESDGIIANWNVQVGELVRKGQLLGVIKSVSNTHEIRSYADGIVVRKDIEDSQKVEKGQSLLTFISDKNFKVRIAIPASQINQVKPKSMVRMALESFPSEKYGHFQGQIEFVDLVASGDRKEFFFALSDVRQPHSISEPTRGPSVDLTLLSGMKAKVYIQTEKLSVFEMIYEKIFEPKQR